MKVEFTRGALLLAALLAAPGGAMAESPDMYRHGEEPIGTIRQVYDGQLFPDLQVNTFRNIDRLFATRTVKAGKTPFPLPAGERRLQNFRFESRGNTYDLYDFMALNRVAGLLVVKDGAVAFEQYALGNDEHTRWMRAPTPLSASLSMCIPRTSW